MSEIRYHKYISKLPKPCYVATHLKALAEYYQMNTNMPGFINHLQHKGYGYLRAFDIKYIYGPDLLTLKAWKSDTCAFIKNDGH